MPRSDAYREAVYREYMEFFEKAERNRRWNVFNDIPWDQLDSTKYSEVAAMLAETFLGVEMYLPDYISKGLNVVRETFGQAWFHANWGYEESKHAFALREYLTRSGQRSFAQMQEYEKAILARSWALPFTTARQMTFYGAIQEQSTFMLYRHQRERAQERGDVVLSAIYGFISRDEAAHADFYRTVMGLELLEDREGTIRDMSLVFRNFKMPAEELVPDYEARTSQMRENSNVDRNVFLKECWFPTLKKLGVTREDITRVAAENRRQGAGAPATL